MNKNIIIILMLLKVASLENKSSILVKKKKSNFRLLTSLYKEGFIQNFLQLESLDFFKSKCLISLRYSFLKPVFLNLKLLSKPSKYINLCFSDICLLYSKKHILFLSTSKGILTLFECKMYGIGGTALFIC
jgi:ribosomal protein S8